MKHEQHYSAPFALPSRNMQPVRTFLRYIAVMSTLSLLVACGNSAEVEPNGGGNNGGGNNGLIPQGTPGSADVLKFSTAFWQPLASNDRCGQCHTNGEQAASFPFVDLDDINDAYSAATSSSGQGLIVDRTDASRSRVVIRAREEGHGCWGDLTNEVCGNILEGYVNDWISDGSQVSGRSITLSPPKISTAGESRNFPDSSTFATLLHEPILAKYCAECHSDTSNTPQAPFFASADIEVAYAAAKSKINLDAIEEINGVLQPLPLNSAQQSRFVTRVLELHNCWTSNCQTDADDMRQAIFNFAQGITLTEIDPKLIISKAMNFTDATLASGGNRYESDQIALWEFKSQTGTIAFDTSRVEPVMDLTFSETGSVSWVLGYGIEFSGGATAQASTTSSQKLANLIKLTNAYSIEAWVIPSNVTQENRRIISLSGGSDLRNFSMSQTLYNYEYLNRATSNSPSTDGSPSLMTADGDEDLQSVLQHVVMTFDPINGRRVYVNGIFTDDVDAEDSIGGTLNEWDDSTFAFILGGEVGDAKKDFNWDGKLRLVAIHNSALTQEQVTQNFKVGVGQKYFMLFSVDELLRPTVDLSVEPARDFIMFETELYDNTAYLFNKPVFISLDENYTPTTSIPLEGLRIGINGREAVSGQVYGNLSTTINSTDYTPNGQELSRLGTVIAIEKGPENDQFFLTFESLGNATPNPRVDPEPAPQNFPADPEAVSAIGIKTFDEINASMSVITKVPTTHAAVFATFDTYRQQLPSIEDINAFLPSHQMAVAQLAMRYCSVRVALDKNPATPAEDIFFKGFDYSQTALTAFTGAAADTSKQQIIEPLLTGIMNMDTTNANHNLDTQADPSVVSNVLGSTSTLNLIDDIRDGGSNATYDYSSLINTMACPTCVNTVARTEAIVTATCAATLGSAMILIQ